MCGCAQVRPPPRLPHLPAASIQTPPLSRGRGGGGGTTTQPRGGRATNSKRQPKKKDEPGQGLAAVAGAKFGAENLARQDRVTRLGLDGGSASLPPPPPSCIEGSSGGSRGFSTLSLSPIHTFGHKPLKKPNPKTHPTTGNKNMRKILQQPSPTPKANTFCAIFINIAWLCDQKFFFLPGVSLFHSPFPLSNCR